MTNESVVTVLTIIGSAVGLAAGWEIGFIAYEKSFSAKSPWTPDAVIAGTFLATLVGALTYQRFHLAPLFAVGVILLLAAPSFFLCNMLMAKVMEGCRWSDSPQYKEIGAFFGLVAGAMLSGSVTLHAGVLFGILSATAGAIVLAMPALGLCVSIVWLVCGVIVAARKAGQKLDELGEYLLGKIER